MMNANSLRDWLLENGGPSIQLQIKRDFMDNPSSGTIEDNISKLLQMDGVNIALNYLDLFRTEERDKKTLEHLIHYYKETCIDNFFPRLMDLGFRAGMPVFDKKMEPVRDIYSFLIANLYDYSIMMSRFFLMGGYAHPEVIFAVKRRIDLIHQAANESIFDIYQDKTKLPKLPKHWVDKGVLKNELNPFLEEKPLPTIYDLAALAYFPQNLIEAETRTKIDDIIKYILEPRFQEIPEGYGLLWVKSRRQFYACGWSPNLPCYKKHSPASNYDIYHLLYYINLMSKFSVAHESEWFKGCISFMEQFRTEKGTYIFPKEYLHQRYITEAFFDVSHMKLKRIEQEEKVRELVSTFYMFKIKKRINDK